MSASILLKSRTLILCLSTILFACAFSAPVRAEPEGSNAADIQNGKTLYNSRCRFCHSPRDGDNRLGPHLFGAVGRVSGTVKGYGYSGSTRNAEITWTPEKLDQFIRDPESVIRGNTMRPYNGIEDPAQRAALIAYMQTLKK